MRSAMKDESTRSMGMGRTGAVRDRARQRQDRPPAVTDRDPPRPPDQVRPSRPLALHHRDRLGFGTLMHAE
ncbi:hypothetical protein [Streptomyces sp. bgisy027]|uniref:hypothetical protein n=1 Tax=Streptomyces sp. bgisy027 TaxID=3413770 RepID=UPI003D7194E8